MTTPRMGMPEARCDFKTWDCYLSEHASLNDGAWGGQIAYHITPTKSLLTNPQQPYLPTTPCSVFR